MKIATLILNSLLGLVFVVFGLNGFLNFIPMPPMAGDAGTFAGVIASTGFLKVVKILEIVVGACILIGFQRPLMYILLMPIVVGILLFELLIAKQPGIGVLLFVINAFLLYTNRDRYMPMING
jgi:putative oxidoreductase